LGENRFFHTPFYNAVQPPGGSGCQYFRVVFFTTEPYRRLIISLLTASRALHKRTDGNTILVTQRSLYVTLVENLL